MGGGAWTTDTGVWKQLLSGRGFGSTGQYLPSKLEALSFFVKVLAKSKQEQNCEDQFLVPQFSWKCGPFTEAWLTSQRQHSERKLPLPSPSGYQRPIVSGLGEAVGAQFLFLYWNLVLLRLVQVLSTLSPGRWVPMSRRYCSLVSAPRTLSPPHWACLPLKIPGLLEKGNDIYIYPYIWYIYSYIYIPLFWKLSSLFPISPPLPFEWVPGIELQSPQQLLPQGFHLPAVFGVGKW